MEKIITEKVSIINTEQTAFHFEMIQSYLDDNWVVKQVFYTPLKNGYSDYTEISITVHLQKSV